MRGDGWGKEVAEAGAGVWAEGPGFLALGRNMLGGVVLDGGCELGDTNNFLDVRRHLVSWDVTVRFKLMTNLQYHKLCLSGKHTRSECDTSGVILCSILSIHHALSLSEGTFSYGSDTS